MVVGEVFAFQNTRPLGYAVVEVDRTNDDQSSSSASTRARARS